MSAALISVYATPPTKRQVFPRLRRLSGSRAPCHSQLNAAATGNNAIAVSTSKVNLQNKCSLILTWNILEDVSLLDWIGMYFLGEADPFNYLDSKNYGSGGRHAGQMRWTLRKRTFRDRGIDTREVKICFKYFDGVTGLVRAVSTPLSVVFGECLASGSESASVCSSSSQSSSPATSTNTETRRQPAMFKLAGLECRQLHRVSAAHCLYYAKCSVNGSTHKTHTTTNTNGQLRWQDLCHFFPLDAGSQLEIVVKERSRSGFGGRRVLGVAQCSVGYLLEQHKNRAHTRCEYAFMLRHPNAEPAEFSPYAEQLLLTVDFTDSFPDELQSVDELTQQPSANPERSASDVEVRARSASTNQRRARDTSAANQQRQPPRATLAEFNLDDALCPMDEDASDSTRQTRRCSRSSRSDTDIADADRETRGNGIAGHSDSGISQCSARATENNSNPTPKTIPNQYLSSDDGFDVEDEETIVEDSASTTVHTPTHRPPTTIKSPRLRKSEKLSVHSHSEHGDSSEHHTLSCLTAHRASFGQPGSADSPSHSRTPRKQLNRVLRNQPIKPINCACKKAEKVKLPSNWEARVDRHGRVFYVDHSSRTTSWQPPETNADATPQSTATASPVPTRSMEQSLRRQQIDKRYSCVRRTIGTAGQQQQQQQQQQRTAESSTAAAGSHWPALTFINRHDFISYIHSSEDAKQLYSSSQALRHIIHRLRRDPSKYEKFQNHQDFVCLMNQFADVSQPLPPGWQPKLDSNNVTLFIDHARRRTTYIDPRLPQAVDRNRRRRARSGPPGQHTEQDTSAAAYHARVVAFIRSDSFYPLLATRLPAVRADQRLVNKLETVRRSGTQALLRYNNDLQLISILSAFETEIMSHGSSSSSKSPIVDTASTGESDFATKLADFYRTLEDRGFGQGPGKLKLTLSRERLLLDAYHKLAALPSRDLRALKLCVQFDDEDGLDYGGPSREFFFLLSRELFNPYYGLFEYSANDTYTVQISPMSIHVDAHLQWFFFCGRILGMALLHRYLIDAFFTRAFYKYLLRRPWTIADLQSLDAQFYSSLQWLQDNTINEQLLLTFAVNEDTAGKVVELELVPGGRELPVTESNKREYIDRMCGWRLQRGIKEQASQLLMGFYDVVDRSLVDCFDAAELELVLSGTVEIDIADWRANTEYKGGYSDEHVVISWFWQAVDGFTNAQRLQLLQFVTGTSSIPYEGFSALRGSHGPKRFTIEKWGAAESLPRAHTCFNRLDLPPYATPHKLHKKLLQAVTETRCYGIE